MTLLFYVLAIASLVITLIFSTFASSSQELFVLASLYLVSNILALLYTIADRGRGGISLMIAFYFFVFVSVPALVQVATDTFPYNSVYRPGQLIPGFTVLSLAQLMFYVGLLTVKRMRKAQNEDVSVVIDYRLYMTSVFWIGLANIGIILYLGPDILFLTRAELSEFVGDRSSFRMQLLLVGRSLSLLPFLIVLYVYRDSRALFSKVRMGLAVILSITVFLVLNYPPGLPRFALFGSALAILSVFYDLYRRDRKLLAVFVGTFFVFFFFPVSKQLGYGALDNPIASAMEIELVNYLIKADFDSFKQVADTVLYLNEYDYRWGMNFLGVLLFFVPRAIWPSKPADSGELVSAALGYEFNNVANPLPSEALISCGFVGVVFLFIFLGRIVALIEREAKSVFGRRRTVQDVAFIYSLTVGFITIILRGSLNGVAPQFATPFLVYFILRYFASQNGKRRLKRKHP